jgi:hypothetical protein
MRYAIIVAAICSLGAVVAGCADPNTKATHVGFGTGTDTMTMGPALRMVSERDRPVGPDGPIVPTVCTEPSPDVAVAFGRSFSGQGSYSETGGPSISGNVSAATTETATQLAGRTAGVLALRDGLYAACQSYVNGVLGHDAYAMILSQYGNLLVAMAGTGNGGNPTPYTPQEAAITAMLVACISEHDPTRIHPYARRPGDSVNKLLDYNHCNALLGDIRSGKLLAPKAKPAAAPANKKQAQGPKAGEKVTVTTVTEKSGAPFSPVVATGPAAK